MIMEDLYFEAEST